MIFGKKTMGERGKLTTIYTNIKSQLLNLDYILDKFRIFDNETLVALLNEFLFDKVRIKL